MKKLFLEKHILMVKSNKYYPFECEINLIVISALHFYIFDMFWQLIAKLSLIRIEHLIRKYQNLIRKYQNMRE